MSKVNFKVEDGFLKAGIDANEDGQESMNLKLSMNEAIQEAFQKGVSIEGAKVVDFKFELTRLKLVIDTDKDGENLLELDIDLAEAIDEATGAFKK